MDIVVTLTTIPSRLVSKYTYDMRYCLESLLEQTYQDYEIHLNIPNKLKFTDEEYIIPEWLEEMENNHQKLKLFRGVEDLGPATKLVHTVNRINNPECLIIVVDDDLIYRNTLIEEHIENQKKFDRSAVGYDGISSIDRFYGDMRDHFCSGIKKDSRVKVLQHYKSISYKRSFFEEDFFKFINENLTWNDDVLISAYMSLKNIDKIVTHHKDDKEFENEEEWRAGVGTTFPIVKNTQHDRKEGCNLFRDKKMSVEVIDNLYKKYIG